MKKVVLVIAALAAVIGGLSVVAAPRLIAEQQRRSTEHEMNMAIWRQSLSQPQQPVDRSNETVGCLMLANIVVGGRASACPEMIRTVKSSSVEMCVASAMATRMMWEPLSLRPAGMTLHAAKACTMMANNASEASVDRASTLICRRANDPQFVRECRGAGYL